MFSENFKSSNPDHVEDMKKLVRNVHVYVNLTLVSETSYLVFSLMQCGDEDSEAYLGCS